ncbi:MAG: BtrH N-terminal domain-containing protein [Promethearchaeota archaeon]
MKLNSSCKSIVIVTVLTLVLLQPVSSQSGPVHTCPGYNPSSEGYGHISGVPYQWQEINGFCHWSALSMALQYAGAPLDLGSLFAASGIGFSASYLRFEDLTMFLPGAFFKQMEPLPVIADIFGLNISIYFDTNEGFGSIYGQALSGWGIEFTEINGWTGALELLKKTIDEGYPLEVWTDPYHLPPRDYDIARDLGLESEETGSGHAVVIVGYNDTASTVEIMDPGVGAGGIEFGYPDDGRWYYETNYTNLKDAWSPLGYGAVIVRPNGAAIGEFEESLVSYLLDRLQGDRTSYAAGFENVFFWNFGADAYRGLALDLTPAGIAGFLDEVSTSSETRCRYLKGLSMELEGFLGIQYLSFRGALATLPSLLPDLDLEAFTDIGRESLSHFEAISDNATMVDYDYSGGNTILTQTFDDIISAYETSGNLEAALSQNEPKLNEIQDHLLAIADAWTAAAAALESACYGAVDVLTPLIAAGSTCVVVVLVVFMRRRRSK